jgi:6,7-dimethyl-8-ribityllumazine synthase
VGFFYTMSSSLKNLSTVEVAPFNYSQFKIGIVTASWNQEITANLCQGAIYLLLEKGIKAEHISSLEVPGSFELTLGAQWLCEKNLDAVIALGCVIQGETKHFDFICNAVANGITQLNIKYNVPVIFGVLTTNNLEEAKDRSGGKHGNKGVEAAATALNMLSIKTT